jgi:hypothetical protein
VSVATGLVIYWLVIRVSLPALAARLIDAQIEWLRERFRTHPVAVLAGIGAAAAILALPVLAVFRVIYGPFHAPASRRRSA